MGTHSKCTVFIRSTKSLNANIVENFIVLFILFFFFFVLFDFVVTLYFSFLNWAFSLLWLTIISNLVVWNKKKITLHVWIEMKWIAISKCATELSSE